MLDQPAIKVNQVCSVGQFADHFYNCYGSLVKSVWKNI